MAPFHRPKFLVDPLNIFRPPVNGESHSKCSLIINLKLYASLVDSGAVNVEISILKFKFVTYKTELWSIGSKS